MRTNLKPTAVLFYPKLLNAFFLLTSITLLVCCNEVEIIVPEQETFQDLTDEPLDSIDLDFHLDQGSVGFTIDVRKIYKKGFYPTEAIILFQDYPQYNKNLVIDKYTNLAIFDILVDSISETEKLEFSKGIIVKIVIKDSSVEYSQFEENILIDSSNFLLVLDTEKGEISNPLEFKEGSPFLINFEGSGGLLKYIYETTISANINAINPFDPVDAEQIKQQQFYLSKVADNQYMIQYGYRINRNIETTYMGLSDPTVPEKDLDGNIIEHYVNYVINPVLKEQAAVFEFVQENDGWIKLLVISSEHGSHENSFLGFNDKGNTLRVNNDHLGDRVRLIADINWTSEMIGVEYAEPIFGPVKLDFAYRSVLSNCSSAELTEEVGRIETKSRTITTGTKESISLFSSQTDKISATIGAEITASIGGDLYGASLGSTISSEISSELTLTTSSTQGEERFSESSETTSIEVSRTRTMVLRPYTVVQVYDAIKSIDDVSIPYAQIIRLEGSDKDGNELSGSEIRTQLKSNFFGGVISLIGSNYVEISIRGETSIDSVFEATTGAAEVANGCE